MNGEEDNQLRKSDYPQTFLPCREVFLHNSKNKNLLNNSQTELCCYPCRPPESSAMTPMSLVLLVNWASRMHIVAKIQMKKWNGNVLDKTV